MKTKNKGRKIAFYTIIIVSSVFFAAGTTGGWHWDGGAKDLYVPDDYSSIQRAIDSAQYGNTVIVREGVYYEQITMKEGVDVVADGTVQERYDFTTANRTIIDGSSGDGGGGHCGGGGMERGPNVVRGADEATIDGFTLTGVIIENPEEIGPRSGGNGVLCVEKKTLRGTSPTIQNCIITGNSRGIACSYGACPIIRHNKILENPFAGIGTRTVEGYPVTAPIICDGNEISSNGKVYGNAGIGCNGSSPTITNNFISDNGAAGIGCENGATVVITDNEICNNAAAGIGTSEEEPAAHIEVRRNVIHDNEGAGIGCHGVTGEITNNIVVWNDAAGIAVFYTPLDGIYNNVVAFNYHTGIANHVGIQFDIENNICYGNGALGAGTGIKDDTLGYDYNCCYGNNGCWGSGCVFPEVPMNYGGYGLIGDNLCPIDPLFVNPSSYDFHLQSASPCIDTGNPLPAFNDIDDTRNDMGAYGGPDPLTIM
jgi:hypothetical protein